MILSRASLALLQMTNLIIWLSREKFVKSYHQVHFLLTVLFMVFSALPSGCEAPGNFADQVYCLCMIVGVAIFSQEASITPLQTFLTKVIACTIFIVSQAVYNANSFEHSNDVFVLIIIVAATTSYASIAFKQQQERTSRRNEMKKASSQDSDSKKQTYSNSQTEQEPFNCQSDCTFRIKDKSEADVVSDAKVTFGQHNVNTHRSQQLVSAGSFNFFNLDDKSAKSDEKLITDIVFTKIQGGLAITDDWLNAEQLSDDESENQMDESDKGMSDSSILIAQKIQNKIERSRQSDKILDLSSQKTISSQIMTANNQFLRIMSEDKSNFTISLDTFNLEEIKENVVMSTKIFTKRCLYPLLKNYSDQ